MGALSLLIFLPLIALAGILILPNRFGQSFKYIALVVTLVQFGLAGYLYANYNGIAGNFNEVSSYQYVEQLPWIRLDLGSLGKLEIDYFLGVDGFSLPLLLLSAFVMLMAVGASWNMEKSKKGYFALLMLLNTAVMGIFCALDFFLFYVFYEVMLLPLYFLIGIWGGARREYAAIKFFIYTLFGSVFMLLVIVGLYFSVQNPNTGAHTFNMLYMMNPENYVQGSFFDFLGNTNEILGILLFGGSE